MDLIFNRHRRKKGEDDIYLLDDMMSLILITYRHQDGMAGFNYIYVLWHLTMLNISIYCPPLLYYCIVDPCAEQDLWSVSSGVGRVASWARLQLWLRLRVLRGGEARQVQWGGGSDRHRALWGEEWGLAHGAGSMAPLYPHTLAPTVGRTGHWPGLDTTHHHQSTSHRSQSQRSSLWITRSQPELEERVLECCDESGVMWTQWGYFDEQWSPYPCKNSLYRGENIQNKVLLLKCRGIICWKD